MARTKSTFLALVAVLLSPMAANADPIVLTYTDTFDSSAISGVSAGDSWFLEVILDNGGASLASQSWSASDLISGLFTSGSYTQSFTGDMCGSFSTNAAGSVTTSFCGTFGVNTDSFGGAGSPYLANNAIRDSASGSFSFFTNGSMSSNPGNWSAAYAAVPEPGTLALFGIGLLGMGLTRRKKKA